MDHVFTRGAVAAFTLGALVAAAPAARAQGGGVIVRAAQRDTMVLLRIVGGPGEKAKFESLTVIMRMLESEPGTSPIAIRLRGEVDTLVRSLTAAHARMPSFFRGPDPRGMWEAQRLKGWIGVNVGLAPREVVIDGTGHYERYLAYPQIVSVEQDSPASRAGLARGDILVAYDGQDVVRGPVNLSELLVPDRKISVTVRREGEVKDFSVIVAKAPDVIAERRWIELRPAMPGRSRVERSARLGNARGNRSIQSRDSSTATRCARAGRPARRRVHGGAIGCVRCGADHDRFGLRESDESRRGRTGEGVRGRDDGLSRGTPCRRHDHVCRGDCGVDRVRGAGGRDVTCRRARRDLPYPSREEAGDGQREVVACARGASFRASGTNDLCIDNAAVAP